MAKQSSEGVTHLGAVRMRVRGSGTLRIQANSYDSFKVSTLPNITMAGTTNIQPTVLSNFAEQRIQLEIKTTAINEIFNITRIIAFLRPVATGYPQ